MSYEVTATRRRPQNFEALVGQEFVAETFRNSISAKKIAHAYLFSGPRGCGKTSTARILAKALNCKEGPTSSPCGKCQQCQEITKGTCTDVIEIDGASNTSVNDIRQIKDEVLFPPQSCRYKIYIIDEVHMLSTSAFNALLKTIEEPPPYVIFIFATTELQKVPATIKSRCQQFNFRLVPIEKVKEQLALAAAEIGIKAQDEALYWIARESTGSMRDAYTLFDQVAAFSGDEITYDKIRDKLGLVGVDRLNEIFEDCVQNHTKEVLEKLDSFLQSGISIEQLISNSTDYLRSLLLIKTGITKESLLGQSAERYSQKVLEVLNSTQIERAISIFLQLYRDIRYSLSPRFELELAFSRLSSLTDYVSPGEVKAALEQTKSILLKDSDGSNQSEQPQKANNPPPQGQIFNPRPQSFSYGGAEPPQKPATNRVFINNFENSSTPQVSPPSFQQAPQIEKEIEPVKDLVLLKSTLIKELSMQENFAMLSSTLDHTENWKLSGNTIYAQTLSEFDAKKIQMQIVELNSVLSKYYGSPVNFNISVKQIQKTEKVEELPKEVQLVCSIFRGAVVAKGDLIDSKNASVQPQQNTQEPLIENSDEDISITNTEIMEEDDESF